MGLGDLFDQPVLPQQDKQIIPKLPTYEEFVQGLLKDAPPDYDEDEEIDYSLGDEDTINEILKDLNIKNYEDVEYQLNQPEMTSRKTKSYLNKIINDAN